MLITCPRCKKPFAKQMAEVCAKCEPEEMEHLAKVKAALADLPEQNLEVITETTGVTAECVLRLIKEGYFVGEQSQVMVSCGMCGKPALSITKRICEACLAKLDSRATREKKELDASIPAAEPAARKKHNLTVRAMLDTKRS